MCNHNTQDAPTRGPLEVEGQPRLQSEIWYQHRKKETQLMLFFF